MSIEAVAQLEFNTLAMMLSLGMRWGQRPEATPEEGVLTRKTVRQLAPVLPPSDIYVLIGTIESEVVEWQNLKEDLLERVTVPTGADDAEV